MAFPNSKLDESKVLAIIQALRQGDPYLDIADAFEVSYGTICSIASGRGWGHLPEVHDYAQIRNKRLLRLSTRQTLNKTQVDQIVELLYTGLPIKQIAHQFHVTDATIWNIATGHSWNDLESVQAYAQVHYSIPRSHSNRKLTSEQIDEIRALIKQGHTLTDIAATYEVSLSLISRINNGTRRQHR